METRLALGAEASLLWYQDTDLPIGGEAGSEELPLGTSTEWFQFSWAVDAMALFWPLQNSRALDIANLPREFGVGGGAW